jgi:hypothetical protein
MKPQNASKCLKTAEGVQTSVCVFGSIEDPTIERFLGDFGILHVPSF